MNQADLAKAAGISMQALNAIEQGKSVPRAETLRRIREALENRGIEFTNGDEPGVKLRPSKAIIPI
jgi:transcriptional regulator with XRE-family HTH domain